MLCVDGCGGVYPEPDLEGRGGELRQAGQTQGHRVGRHTLNNIFNDFNVSKQLLGTQSPPLKEVGT